MTFFSWLKVQCLQTAVAHAEGLAFFKCIDDLSETSEVLISLQDGSEWRDLQTDSNKTWHR